MMKLIIISFAFFIRIIFIVYGTIHDEVMEVKFTDIDYNVFTDAAEYVTNGKSPYVKSTYKYTPLLAYMLTPNLLLHPLFGKVLFCACDIIVVLVMDIVLRKVKNYDKELSNMLIMTFWMFNPFTMTISSRGNAESVMILLVLLSVLFVMERKLVLAGVFYGLSVHFKLYPIIYTLPFVMYIGDQGEKLTKGHCSKTVRKIINSVLSLDSILFGVTSLLVFCILGCFMYSMYPMEFIENTYLYHFSRTDIQHNFSPYFYILRISQYSRWSNCVSILAFLPQVLSVVWCGMRYYKQLPLACFLQTFVFVALNKVCTSQYFIWYIGLFPLAYPFMRIPLKQGCIMVTSWLVGQGVWLCLAYLLEFQKYNVIIYVWLASIMFLLINLLLLYKFTAFVQLCKQVESEKIFERKDK